MQKEIDDLYGIIQAMREAKDKYCTDNCIEGSFYCADITVYEMDMSFTEALRKVEDYERGYNRFWASISDREEHLLKKFREHRGK